MFQLTCHQREALDPKQLRVGIEKGLSANTSNYVVRILGNEKIT